MHKRRLRGVSALKVRLLRLRSISSPSSQESHCPTYSSSRASKGRHVKLKQLLKKWKFTFRTMCGSEQAKIVVYIEFGFLGLGTMVAGILVLFPQFFLDVILQEVSDAGKREHLRAELGTLTTLGSAVIAIALLAWLIVVLTLCQGVRGISPPRLTMWLVINTIPTAAGIAAVTAAVVVNPDTASVYVPAIIFLLYKLWSLWVVRRLRKDIKRAGPPDNFHALHQRHSRSYSTHSTPHPHCPS